MGKTCSSLNFVARRREFKRMRDQHTDIMHKLKLTHDEFAGMVKEFNHLARKCNLCVHVHSQRGRGVS